MFARNIRIEARRVRLYQSIRTAHLERAHELGTAAIVYQVQRYDFDESAAKGIELMRASPIETAFLIARSDLDVVEINEPLMLSSLLTSSLTIAALRLRYAGNPRRRPDVVTYAIGNSDPFAQMPTGARLRTRLRRRGERVLARYVMKRVDRVAFGTSDARALYGDVLGDGRSGARSTVIEALPAACECIQVARDADTVVFLGALVERKGFPLVLEAWEHVLALHPSARLRILGKGPLESVARAATDSTASVSLHIDPDRSDIHTELRRSAVLVLPSQASATWREQVGLPIVEGLAHGTTVVTTRETGLASWLDSHGHGVVDSDAGPGDLARAIVDRLIRRRSADEVLATLPARDGRLEADDWLFAAPETPVISRVGPPR
ncbi:glycosyltransferase family 4 protein [Marisediminicola sp. LYQ134]|uniref:glycosyltransferase family 4 protein n=1 Tax=Marisediminicola sp. LYQ134 TaxID=3391061 RepID=UPI003983BE04